MKSLTGIFKGFDKCTKASLQNNYFWGTPPDDCFCLERSSRYNYNKSAESLKLFWYEEVAGRWIETKICWYYIIYWKSFPSFPVHSKKFYMLFLFNFIPQQILNFLFIFHFVKLRILAGKKHPQIKLQRLEKVRI